MILGTFWNPSEVNNLLFQLVQEEWQRIQLFLLKKEIVTEISICQNVLAINQNLGEILHETN